MYSSDLEEKNFIRILIQGVWSACLFFFTSRQLALGTHPAFICFTGNPGVSLREAAAVSPSKLPKISFLCEFCESGFLVPLGSSPKRGARRTSEDPISRGLCQNPSVSSESSEWRSSSQGESAC